LNRFDAVSLPADRDARRAWQERRVPAVVPYPAPEVARRPFDVATLDARTSIVQLARLAASLGWSVRATFSRGHHMHDSGRPGPVVDCVALSLSHNGARYSVARWERRDGKSYALEMARTPYGRTGWAGIKDYVRAGVPS
jgi:hypothetical protein